MICALLLSIFVISNSQRQTAICDIEKFFDLGLNEEMLDHARINSTDIILTNKNIWLIDENLNVLSTLVSPNISQYQCNKVVGHDLSNLFFVACQSNGTYPNPYFVAYKQINQTNYEKFGDQQYIYTLVQKFDKFIIAANTLLIPQQNKIIFYTIVIQASSWYLKTTTFVLDGKFLQYSSLNITDFTLSPYTKDLQLYYRIFVIDYEFGILWVSAVSRSNNLIPFDNGAIDLKTSRHITYPSKYREAAILQINGDYTKMIIFFYLKILEATKINIFIHQGDIIAFCHYKGWKIFQNLKAQGNIASMSYKNNQQAVVKGLYNVLTSSDPDPNIQHEPDDILISAPIDNSILYFISENRLVYRSDSNSLTRCTISNYNYEMIK